MSDFVIDASVAAKWVIEEEGTAEALRLRQQARLLAPDLLLAECANIFWKKVRRKELSPDEALFAARLLAGAEIELLSTRSLCEPATRMSIDIGHSAYDCLYLALAVERDCPFITADERLVEKVRRQRGGSLHRRIVSLKEAAPDRL